MGRILAYVLTAILAVCFVILLNPKGGMPRGFAVSCLVAIGLLWAVVLGTGLPGWLKGVLLVVVFLLSFTAILFGYAMGVADRPRREDVVRLGEGGAAGALAIVYHPGGTDGTKTAVLALGEKLAAKGYAVSIFTAHPGLGFDQAKYQALILGSPVYAGQTRPPVKEFAAANAPLTMPVFALFTGSGATPQEQDREQFDKVVTGAGGRLTATAKVTANEGGPGAVERQMATFAEVVERALKGRP